MSPGLRPASLSAALTGPRSALRDVTRSSSLARVKVTTVLGPVASADVGQVDSVDEADESSIFAFGGLLETLRYRRSFPGRALVLLELRQQPVDDALVEVVAAEVRVAAGRLDLETPSPS
jgi:hypothetical protein